MDRTQRVNEENGTRCLVIMFASGVMVIGHNGSFMYFYLSYHQQHFNPRKCRVWVLF